MKTIMSGLENATFANIDSLLSKLGNRGRDFIRCFDVSSIWCQRYAYIVMQGLVSQNRSSYELHHIVPIAYYRAIGLQCDRQHRQVCRNNLTSLSRKEHIFVHFCMVLCCCNRKVKTKLIRAFYLMYYGFHRGNHIYNESIQTHTILKFDRVTEVQVISYLADATYTQHSKSAGYTYSEGRVYLGHTKYPLVPVYSWIPDFKVVLGLSSLKTWLLVPIYNTRYLWMRKTIVRYIQHVRILSIDQSIKKNIRFNDYSLHLIPKEYAARFLSICVCHRVWKNTIYDTIAFIDDYLKLPPIRLPLHDSSNAVIFLKYNKPRKPIRYRRIFKETPIMDEPIVLLHGCNL